MLPGALFLSACILAARPVASQQIWDIWQTTWDRQGLFTSLAPSTPINFVTPGPAQAADIVVTDTSVYQTINGFGGSLTDSSALTLNNLKGTNSANYWSVLGHMFSVADGANASGFSYIRVPIGASDFSGSVYSLDDVSGDTSFSHFNINNAPSYLFSVIKDILSINPALKVHIVPWSPPGWMKTTGTMNGGTIQSSLVSAYPTYLLKAVQGFVNQGITIYAISVQNEPENSNPTYPTCTMTPAIEGQIGAALRTLLNNNGLGGVKVVGYEHNWNDAANYPVQLMQDDGSSYDGVAFHCYSGTYSQQGAFQSAFPNKNIYFTECSGTIGSDWWSDIKWYMDNLWIGSLQYGAGVGLMFNLALDGNGHPTLPGTNSCATGCRPIVTVNADGSYAYNQEFYALAQASKAIIPKDAGGPWGQRIGVTVQGSLSWALRVGAYSTKRLSSTDWNRISLVVMNWDDSASTTWNPVPVTATIEYRGMQATYTFPVGVTTLWWFAPPNAQAGAAGNVSISSAVAPPIKTTTTSAHANVTSTFSSTSAKSASTSSIRSASTSINATHSVFTGMTSSHLASSSSSAKSATTSSIRSASSINATHIAPTVSSQLPRSSSHSGSASTSSAAGSEAHCTAPVPIPIPANSGNSTTVSNSSSTAQPNVSTTTFTPATVPSASAAPAAVPVPLAGNSNGTDALNTTAARIPAPVPY